MGRELEEALASGPFSLALQLAVKESGLSLDRLQHKLAERGVRVSKTALSYWQHGRTRPERPGSLRALAVLEEVLGLKASALSGLLGPPRPRGRWLTLPPSGMRDDQAWARPDGLVRALERMGSSLEAVHRLTKIGFHVTSTVDARRNVVNSTYRVVLRAERDGVDRHLVALRSDAGVRGPLRVTDTLGCRIGRQREDQPTGFHTYELLLDHPLHAGELTVIQYTVWPAAERPDCYQTHRVWPGLRDLSVLVRFDPGMLPIRVYRSQRREVNEDEVEKGEVWLGASHTAQLSEVDPEPGIYRIAWDWE